MIKRTLLVGLLALAPLAPALAMEEEPDLRLPAGLPTDLSQVQGLPMAPSGLGTADMGSVMRLVRIGQSLKGRAPVAPDDLRFVRDFLKRSGAGLGDGSNAAMMQKLDQVLTQLQQRMANPTEDDALMRELADGADMTDLPSLED